MLLPSSDPLHTYMVFHLLHTMMPALDSRFTETAKNLSVALGSREGVSRHKHGRALLMLFQAKGHASVC